jgi:hypothetical protein
MVSKNFYIWGVEIPPRLKKSKYMNVSSLKMVVVLLSVFALGSCAKTEYQTFGEMKIEQLQQQNRDAFVFKCVNEQKIETTDFGTGDPIYFTFEFSNTCTDTVLWLNYEELANNNNDFIKVYRQGEIIGTPYKTVYATPHKKWHFRPGSMVRFSMTWINNDKAKNEYIELASSQPMNNFLEKGDYCAKIRMPIVYTKAGVTDTIICNKSIYFTVSSKK